MTLICNGDIDRPLKIEIFDYEKSGKHVFMGEVNTSVRTLMDSKGSAQAVIDPAKRAKKGDKYINSGTLHATYCSVEENPTFTDVSTSVVVIARCEFCITVQGISYLGCFPPYYCFPSTTIAIP